MHFLHLLTESVDEGKTKEKRENRGKEGKETKEEKKMLKKERKIDWSWGFGFKIEHHCVKA